MALIAKGLSLMSVGISCQVAQQLRIHAEHLGEIRGEPFEVHTTPFDWTICKPAGVAAMLEGGRILPPASDLVDMGGKPYWPATGCYFWHMKGAITDHAAALEQTERQRSHFAAIKASERKAFILATTQNNVARTTRAKGAKIRPDLLADDVVNLHLALYRTFGACELWVVTYPGQMSRHYPRLIELEPDRSSWEGDRKQWRAALERVITGI